MPSSTIGTSLADKLIGVADNIRALATTFGTRQWRVYLVKRQWSGEIVGDGTASFVSQVEITPRPKVVVPDANGVHGEERAVGLEEEGEVVLSEVSLTFTEAELYKPSLTAKQEFYYRFVDGQGQAIRNRYYLPAAPPLADRQKTLGWVIRLHRAEIQE